MTFAFRHVECPKEAQPAPGLTHHRSGQRTTSTSASRLVPIGPRVGSRNTALAKKRRPSSDGSLGRGSETLGSNGRPVQSGSGTPEIGNPIEYSLANGPRGSAALLVLGLSDTAWSGLPLPFQLPGTACTIFNDWLLGTAVATTGTGVALVSMPLPTDAALIGARHFTQYWCVDPAANTYGLSLSDQVETTIGGWVVR